MSCLQAERVFNALEVQFTASSLASTLTLDGNKVGHGMETTSPSLEYVRMLVQDPGTEIAIRDAIWAELVRLAQQHAGEWQLAAIWMMLPGLRTASRKIFYRTRVEVKEIDSAVITGFIEALQVADPNRPHLGAHLWWKAHNHAMQTCTLLAREMPVEDIELVAGTQGGQADHGDYLSRAVHEGILTGVEADLIGRTRLEGERLGAVAEQMGLKYHACQQRRARAETRLAGYLLLDGAPTHAKPSSRRCRARRRPTQSATDAA
ncbi:hypothetical protein [Actinoallomurus iriomotensis]|uniref:Uncharacterized protein n=1 Tax=Actinoallomurus iriomotensis TaxID=478107 RepID=A0A9W6S112_9ACTN|nr:hypothetical protein [Actinoallomurus iriomotensis]GLY85995.1 hypothetical protein Airi02_039240 [Actinoallomurus iriomotensis]